MTFPLTEILLSLLGLSVHPRGFTGWHGVPNSLIQGRSRWVDTQISKITKGLTWEEQLLPQWHGIIPSLFDPSSHPSSPHSADRHPCWRACRWICVPMGPFHHHGQNSKSGEQGGIACKDAEAHGSGESGSVCCCRCWIHHVSTVSLQEQVTKHRLPCLRCKPASILYQLCIPTSAVIAFCSSSLMYMHLSITLHCGVVCTSIWRQSHQGHPPDEDYTQSDRCRLFQRNTVRCMSVASGVLPPAPCSAPLVKPRPVTYVSVQLVQTSGAIRSSSLHTRVRGFATIWLSIRLCMCGAWYRSNE